MTPGAGPDIVVPEMSAPHQLTRSTFEMVERVRLVVERSPLAMVATDGPAHVVRYVNPEFCKLVGLPPETIVGNPLRDAVGEPAEGGENDPLAVLDRVYAAGTAEPAVDLGRVFASDEGSQLWCAVWPILDDKDRPGGLLVQVHAPPSDAATGHADSGTAEELRDVNERLLVAGLRALEQAEAQTVLRSQAEAALTVRDEFMSIAAHELRTPVTGIKISAQLALRALQNATPREERTIHYLLGIVGGANRLVLLINDLMDVSRMQSGELLLHLAAVDLAALVSAVAQRYVEIGGDRHHVFTDLPAAPLIVDGDAGRLEQILDNLLSNAIKYSPGGGDIGVRLRQAAEGITLTVSDAGIGLPPGAEERIFEPFGRAANAAQQGLPGMGLGLHICRRIAEAHGGRMWAESGGENQGMAVSVWLPCPSQQTPE